LNPCFIPIANSATAAVKSRRNIEAKALRKANPARLYPEPEKIERRTTQRKPTATQTLSHYRGDGFNLYYGFKRSDEKGENNADSESRKMRSREDPTRSFR
jgi:hypothetical protein